MQKRIFVALLPLLLVGAGCAKTEVATNTNAAVNAVVNEPLFRPGEPEVIDKSVATYENTNYGYSLNKAGSYLIAFPAGVSASLSNDVKLAPSYGDGEYVEFSVRFHPTTLEAWKQSILTERKNGDYFYPGTFKAVSTFQGHQSIEYVGGEEYVLTDSYHMRAIAVEGGTLVVTQNKKSARLDAMFQSFTLIK